MDLLLFIVPVVAVAAVVTYTFAGRRRAWEDFAYIQGLELRGWYFSPVIEGRYRGVSIHVGLGTRAMQKRQTVTQYRIAVGEPMPAGLSVCSRGLLGRLAKVVDARGVTTGNPELDDALSIHGVDAERVIRLLGIPEVGTAVLAMAVVNPGLQIGQGLWLEEIGFADAEHLRSTLDALCDLAHVLEAGSRQLAVEDEDASLRDEGEDVSLSDMELPPGPQSTDGEPQRSKPD
jgi:hypothetical protein